MISYISELRQSRVIELFARAILWRVGRTKYLLSWSCGSGQSVQTVI